MLTQQEREAIKRLILCILKWGDCDIRRELRDELKLLANYLRLKKRRRKLRALIIKFPGREVIGCLVLRSFVVNAIKDWF